MPRNFFGGLDRRGDKPQPKKPSLWQRLFGGKGKKARGPDPGRGAASMGHKGIAAGSLKAGEQDLTAGNVARWQNLSGGDVEAFVYDEMLLPVHSTNVKTALYRHDREELEIEFLDGDIYLYHDISAALALEFAKAQSKGGWVWDRLRVRGSATQHQVKYTKLR